MNQKIPSEIVLSLTVFFIETLALRRPFFLTLLVNCIQTAVQRSFAFTHDFDGTAVIQRHHSKDASCIGNRTVCIVNAHFFLAGLCSGNKFLDLSEIGDRDFIHHGLRPPFVYIIFILHNPRIAFLCNTLIFGMMHKITMSSHYEFFVL